MSPQREFLSIFASAVLLGSEGKASGNPLRIILVKKHAEAKQILKRLTRGEFFSYLAKQYSLGPSSQEGGYVSVSWFSNSPLGLEGALQDLKPGQVGEIV